MTREQRASNIASELARYALKQSASALEYHFQSGGHAIKVRIEKIATRDR